MFLTPGALSPVHVARGAKAARGVHFVATPTKSERRRELQLRHRQWIEDLERKLRKPRSRIATDANLSDTTLTRIFRDDYKGALSATTIAEIKRRYGVAGPGESDAREGGFLEGEGTPYVAADAEPRLKAVVEALIEGRPRAHCWMLRTRAVELLGYLPGDVVAVDPDVDPRDGDVVCAQVLDARGEAETVFRLLQEPYLVTASTERVQERPVLEIGRAHV